MRKEKLKIGKLKQKS